jgi:uncharacterized protein YrrD
VTLVRARELIGRPVVTLDRGEDVAEVKDVVFSHRRGGLVGFTLNGRGALASPLDSSLPAEAVEAVGRDAVIVDSTGAFAEGQDAIADGDEVVGIAVVAESGTRIGEVRDVVVDTADARLKVVAYEVDVADGDGDRTALIPLDEAGALSEDALVVPDAARRIAPDDLAALGRGR